MWLGDHSMTESEKRKMRATIAHYATTHPVKSGLMSPYGFRAAFAILATLVLVLGGSAGIAKASTSALPNSKLYPIKLWIEEFQASEQKTPEAVIAFETSRINTRFAEATELAVSHQLNDQASAVIETGLAHSQDLIKQSATQISATNPELALAAANSVETAYSSNGKVLSAIGRNTNQNLDTFILGAQISTESLALEKTHFEQIVATKPNDDSKANAVLALANVQDGLAKLPVTTDATSEAPSIRGGGDALGAGGVSDTTTVSVTTATVSATADTKPAVMMAKMAATTHPLPPLTEGAATAATSPITIKTPADQVADLIVQAKTKMAAGSYSEALVILQKAQQIIDEANLTQSLETTYQVKTDVSASTTTDTTPADKPLPNPLLQGEGAATAATPAVTTKL